MRQASGLLRASRHAGLLCAAFALTAAAGCRHSEGTEPIPPSETHTARADSERQGQSGSLESLHVTAALGLAPGETLEQALSAPFKHIYQVNLKGSGGERTVHNCAEYLPLEHAIYSAGSAADYNGLRYHGTVCDALSLLQSARPSPKDTFGERPFENLRLRDLPPGLVMIVAIEQESRLKAIAARGGSILDAEKGIRWKVTGPEEAELEAKDWTATMKILARADFVGDGGEELLVQRNAAAKQGSYASDRVYVLARPKGSGSLTILRERP